MRAKKIQIKNILGIDELEIEPGKVTVVSGGNGVGKTSVIEALRSALGGGHDATLLRNGAEQGEVVLELDDGMEIRKTVTAAGSNLSLRHPTFGSVSKPQTVLNGLHDALSLNPVDFLTAKDPAKRLLEAVPMKADMDAIRAAVEPAGLEIQDGDPGEHALETIGAIHRAVYDQRREANGVARRLRATVEELRGSLVEGLPSVEDVEAARLAATERRMKAEQDRDEVIRTLKAAMGREIAKADDNRSHALSEAKAAYEATVAKAREEMEAAVREAQSAWESDTADARSEYAEIIESEGARFAGAIEEAQKAEAASSARIEAARAQANTLRMIETREKELVSAEAESETLTKALADLQAISSQAAAAIPIEGVTIEDGALKVDGVVWERVNAAKRVRVAVQLAKLRAGDLRLILVDGLEQLDPEHFEALTAELAASECDAIVTRVTEGALQVAAA